MGVLRTDDINPDGVRIVIDWPSMAISSSVFVPCINIHLVKQQILKIVTGFGWECTVKVVTESDKLGVRVWRTL